MKTAYLPLTLVLLLFTIALNAAETAFVVDKLLVGVHLEEDLNSAIVKVLPTGSKLEVLARKGETARIKDAAGVVGWVDSAYLMPEPPAATQLAQLKQDKQALADRLKALEAAGGKPGSPSGKVDTLTNENTELKSQLSAQKLKSGELETELIALRKTAAAPGTGGGSVAAELQSANLQLADELAQIKQTVSDLRAQIATTGPLREVRAAVALASPVLLFGLGLLVAVSFGGGIYVMDHINRRRHGGFRV